MSIIEQAAKRLEELRRGGVDVPWEAAGLSQERFAKILSRDASAQLPVANIVSGSAGSAPSTSLGRPTKADRGQAQSRVVEINLAKLAELGYLSPDAGRGALAAELRHIKRPILRNVSRSNGRQDRSSLIMITSALPEEGKTFCAINLAMSVAMEVDTSVLLVDADVVRPSVFSRLGLTEERGLLDVLTGDRLDLSEVMLRTNVPKLSLLAAGTRNPMATELLASGAMDELLLELANRYPDRVIILDSPPLLVTSEARVLASRVGQVVVVVDSNRTTSAQVADAFRMLESCPLVMSILNNCSAGSTAGGYGYGYE